MPGEEDAAIVEKLRRNHTLKHLTFYAHMPDDITWFPTILPENCLEIIELRDNALGLNQCRAICESLRGSSCLRELDLSANDIILDDHSAQALNDLLESTPLQMIIFGFNQITTQGTAVLANGLRGNSFLRELWLSDCGIIGEGLIQLGEALVENSTLEIIHLDGNDLDQHALSRFFQLLPQMDGLKELCLTELGVDSEELHSTVVDGLRENTSLQWITGCDEIWHEEVSSNISRT
jgi:Ran GTPase-activating protein (RanGAP) involved in mRNA processing and transport